MKLIGASFVLVCDEIFTILEKGGVVFNNHEIISVGKYDELAQKFSQTLQELHFYDDCVLMPSLSNLHLHLEFSQNEGYLEFGDFGNWLNSVLTHRDTLMGEGLKDTIKSEIQQLLRSGVSFVGAISSYGYDLELLANSPLRVLYFNEVIGSNPEMLDSLWKNVLARFEDSKQFTSKKFFPTLAIHSPYSVHPALLKRVTTLAKEESLPLSVHFLESFQERQWLEKQNGYFKAFFENFFNAKVQPFYNIKDFLESFKDIKVYFTHCLQATKEELQIIKDLKSFVVSCPRSNRLLNHKMLDLQLCESIGIHPIFATDGKSSNDSISILEELKIALYAYKEYDLESLAKSLLLSVTYHAFKENPLGIQAGTLKQGYLPDFAIFKTHAKQQIALSLLLQAKEVEALYIAGKSINLRN